MKEIITNVNHLTDNEITDWTTKVKLLLVNSKRELLLGYSYNEYQFPGGTKESNEELIDAVKRELLEETGIVINFTRLKPFIKSSGYYKDWPEVGKNKKVEIYYYEIETDETPNLNKLNLTDKEKKGNFCLKYIPLDVVEEEINKNVINYGDPHGIAKEMVVLLDLYKTMKNNK